MTEHAWAPPGWQGEAGVSRADITPPVGIRAKSWGAARSDIATGIHRPLSMTALALREDSRSRPVVLITADLGAWRRAEDEWSIRGAVLQACELDPSRLMLHLAHTHSGPSVCRSDVDAPGGEYVPAYLDRLQAAAVETATRAIASCVPATLTAATGRSSVAACRDLPWGDRYVVGFSPGSAADDTMPVARITTADGAVLATIVNYACHPTTLAWDNTLISPDFVGALREVVEDGTGGAPCLFLQGASGDLAPREQYSGDTGLADRHGCSIGHAALAALQTLPAPSHGLALDSVVESGAPLAPWRSRPASWPTTVRVDHTRLPVRSQPVPPEEDLGQRWAGIDPHARAERLDRARHRRADFEADPETRHPVWIWRLGQILLIGHAGEAYSQFQQQVRDRLPDASSFVLNLVNGPSPYLPPARLYEHDVYQVWVTTRAAGTLEQLTEHAVERSKELLAAE